MLTFYLIRHGQKESVPFDPSITPEGEKQAKATALKLREVEFVLFLASPKKRTRKTAEIIAELHSKKVLLDEKLVERFEWNDDVSFDGFLKEWSKTDHDRSYTPERGLSSIANGDRMRKLVDELSVKYADGNICIVTHGGSIGDLLRNIFGENSIEHIIDPSTNAPYIHISECSTTIIGKDGDDYKLVQLNDTSHLSIPFT